MQRPSTIKCLQGWNTTSRSKKSGFNEIEHQKPYDDARRYVHRINIEKETKLEGIVQVNNIEVNSIHHQGIDKLGDDLIISARSEDDVIEGIEITNGWDAIGIQWHPEYLDDEPTSKIYDWLINSQIKSIVFIKKIIFIIRYNKYLIFFLNITKN